ncbi:MAG: recombinase family protein [Rhodobacteraceae bacterium]|nr:recombinase family protein [Paracoccaceae bacterium]
MSRQRKRAAIYARFSTDLQRDKSIDDQVALCTAHATREGLNVARTYSDRARTSSTMIGRDGLQDMLSDAREDRFDVVVVEALDRLSRDQGDLAAIWKRLEFLGIPILSVNDGKADAIRVGVHGLLGQIWLDGHRKKVHRGQAGVIRDGRHAGGRAYGYAPVPGKPGELTIVEHEAEIIRRIFESYAAGDSPRTIAAALNAEAVPPPRGLRWNASTINGNPQRGYGILSNEIYRGEIVWNRVQMIRDPETGKRVSRPNPESDWQRAPAPHLRIVDQPLWDRVQLRRTDRTTGQTGPRRGRGLARPKRPFSGLLRCGCCGGGIAISKTRGESVWGRCSTRTESGSCDNKLEMRIDRIEAAVFESLGRELKDPVYVRTYLKEYHAERMRLQSEARRDRARLERATARAKAAFDRAFQLYIYGVTDGPAAEADIHRLQNEAREAEAALARADETHEVLEIHPASIERYIGALADLAGRFHTADPDAVGIIRELVSAVVVTPTETGLDVVVEGFLGAIPGDNPKCRVLMVAEGRYRRPPRQDGGVFEIAI